MTGRTGNLSVLDVATLLPPKRSVRWRARLTGTASLALVLIINLLVVTSQPATAATGSRPTPQTIHSVGPGTPVKPHPVTTAKLPSWRPTPTSWPSAGTAVADLTATRTPAAPTGAKPAPAAIATAGSLPVSVAAVRAGGPSRVTVSVASHTAAVAAGVDGLLLSARPSEATAGSGPVRLSVDFSSFAYAFGGNYAQRLHLVALPVCALTTPTAAGCRQQTPLATTVDGAADTLTAQVTLPSASATASRVAPDQTVGSVSAGTVVVAATAGPSGTAGDYTATSLKPSGTWTAGNSAGDFTYSYPINVPPVAGSLLPDVTLAYDAQSVDGEQVSTNNQSSWIGDGWDYSPGFIERSYTDCADDPAGTAPKTGDMCWLSGQGPLHIDLDGHSGDIVWDATHGYHIAGDNGESITLKTDGTNGTYDGDYFEVVDQSGTQYYFGRNRLPGWVSGDATTNSAWTEPVYGAHSGDPCFSSSGFAQSVCTQAWRWNLDYVVDTHHNAIAYYYQQETNYYGKDNTTTGVQYVRGGFLDRVDYGLVDPNPYTGNGGHAPAQVTFTTGERCLVTSTETCAVGNITAHPTDWPDVPFDQNCNSGATCNHLSPTSWSRKRLTGITSQIWNGTGYSPVDTYALTQSFPAPGDGTTPSMWLASIQHTGKDGTAVALPPVTFSPTNLPNRVDGIDLAPAMNHNRVATITSESGEVLQVDYSSLAAPCVAPVTIAPSANTSLCYPVFWTPSGFTTPHLDWFAKYVVSELDDQDPTGGSPGITTTYRYLDGAGWHYDDNETVKSKYRTWGQWRGFDGVQTRTGSGGDAETLSETYYFRGMNGDTLPNNGTRTVNTTLSTNVAVHGATTGLPATSVPDNNLLAGQPREQIDYTADAADAAHVSQATVNDYWVGVATATRTRTGLPSLTSNFVRPVATYTATAITQNSPTTYRTTETDTTFNTSTGLPIVVYDYGDISQPSQARCTTTTYAPASSGHLLNLPAEVETDAKGCGGSGVNGLTSPASLVRPADVVSDTRTFYDDPPFAATWPLATPSKGDASMTLTASDYTTSFVYLTTGKSTYDSFGRVLTDADANGNFTTTAYTLANGLPTAATVTNPLGQTTTTTYAPSRGLPTKIIDPNGLETDERYDALGRLTNVWLPGNNNTANPANDVYTYLVSQTLASAVTAQVMNENGSYRTSVTLYDALDRSRQTQTQAAGSAGGRLVTDTYYDSRGWAFKVNQEYWDSSSGPSTTLLDKRGADNQISNEDVYTFDGLGRQTLDVSQMLGVEQWRTTTIYGGDRTTTIPPSGGTPTTTITDGLGRTIEQDSYTTVPTVTGNRVTGGAPVKVTYGFDHRGNASTTTDNAGDVWTSTYNLLGRVTTTSDPDSGSTPANAPNTYDNSGNLLSSTDSRGKTVSYSYDALNRKTGEYDGPNSSSPRIAAYTYDSAPNGVGQPASTTTYDPPGTANAYVVATNGYSKQYKPTGSTITIPADPANGGLAGSYTFTNTYSPTNGLLTKTAFPATAGVLPSETVGYAYTVTDLPYGVGDLLGDYIDNTTYNQFGLPSQVQVNTGTNKAWINSVYDQHTNRLAETDTDRVTVPTRLDALKYLYSPSGLITRETDTHNNTSTETQCFDYNLLDRLSTAWTATDSCAADLGQSGATNATVGDSNGGAYWTSWTYSTVGDRTQEIDHHLPGQTGDTTTNYSYPTGGQPNTLRGTSTTAPGGPSTTSYGFDTAGDMTSRVTPGHGAQTLAWNDAGQLATVTSAAGTSSYTYDTDGNTLVERDPGSVTLYLPGEQLVLNTSTGAKTGTRYYTGPGGATAVRTGTAAAAYSILVTDQNNTAQLSLDHTGQLATWRQFTPYGAPRGTAPATWPDTHQYLDRPTDTATGLDLFGVRQYDPTTGQFVSQDPSFGPDDPNQINGYTYAGDDPITDADPTGQWGFHIHIHIGNPLKALATVASIVSIVPGPIGMAASGIAAVSYAATGDWKNAAIMGAGVALAAVGAGAAAVVATRAVKAAQLAVKADKAINDADDLANAARNIDEAANAASDSNQAADIAKQTKPSQSIDAPEPATRGETCANSFNPDTPVLMADGSTTPIKDVAVGDAVDSTDPTTGITVAEPVTQLHDNHDTDLTDLTITTTNTTTGITSGSVLHTTTEHPFWDATTHQWTNAGQLQPGDRLTTTTPHTSVTVTAVHTWIGAHDMRNLTVNATHTYYVIAGTTPVLVHNCLIGGGNHRGSGDSLQAQDYRPRHTYEETGVRTHEKLTIVDRIYVHFPHATAGPEAGDVQEGFGRVADSLEELSPHMRVASRVVQAVGAVAGAAHGAGYAEKAIGTVRSVVSKLTRYFS